jgi:hypothetical protein
MSHLKTNIRCKVIYPILILLLASCNMPKVDEPSLNIGSVATKVILDSDASTLSPNKTPVISTKTPTEVQPQISRTPNQTSTETTLPTKAQIPTLSPTNPLDPTTALTITQTPILDPGTIAGNIFGYPYGSVPSMVIVAFGQEPPYNYSWLITGAGETYFLMGSNYLIPGHFQVVAYDSSGHTGGCTTIVLVSSNQTVNCDITSWGGGFPAKPSAVPFP